MNTPFILVKYMKNKYYLLEECSGTIQREIGFMPEKEKKSFKNTIGNIFTLASVMLMNIACLKIGTARLGIDYATFYTTGKMVISGDISSIYSMPIHHSVLENLVGAVPYFLEWVYPPTFLFAVVPLVFLPLQVSFVLWMIVTFIPAAFAVYFLSNKNKLAPLVFSLFPGTFLNIRWGQNGFLTAALLGFGIYFAETNPLMSGLMFGLLTFKPQIAMIPFVILLALKKWNVFGWSCLFAATFAAISGLVFGYQPWFDFVSTTFNSSSMLSDVWAGAMWGIPTLYTSLRCMGLSGIVLSGILVIFAAASIYACVRVWKQTNQFSMRAMSLVMCLFLTLPYISLYECSLIGIPFTLLFFECIDKKEWSFHPYALLLLWILPLICLFIFVKSNIQLFPFVLAGYMIAVVYFSDKKRYNVALKLAK